MIQFACVCVIVLCAIVLCVSWKFRDVRFGFVNRYDVCVCVFRCQAIDLAIAEFRRQLLLYFYYCVSVFGLAAKYLAGN